MKISKSLLALAIGAAVAATSFAQAEDKIVVGFSQIGAESEWRTANTNDVMAAAERAGVELKFSDAQQKQENQIKAIRSFISQKVDIIGFVPIVETGWDNVLREAKRAKIPVVIMDRDLKTDPSLYTAKIGTDSVEEGRKAFRWIDEYVILEAKNLIKYSDMSIQEISYALNFPNQSFFGKYFKKHAGISPKRYRDKE